MSLRLPLTRPTLALSVALLWGMVEFVALCRARLVGRWRDAGDHRA